MIREKNYKLRVIGVLIIFFILYALVLVRLFFIQIYYNDFFMQMGHSQYNVRITLDQPRASIFDRNGVALAINKEVASAFVLPHQFKDRLRTMAFLQKHYPQVHQRILDNPDRYFIWVERRLSSEREAWIKEHDCVDINFVPEYRRFYPFIELASVIGMTDIDNQGIAGLELANSSKLAGKPSCYTVQKDARSNRFYFEKTINKEGVAGVSVTTTIDRTLQFLAYEELKKTIEEYEAKRGAVLVLDPYSGEIEAMVSYPTFDPNGEIPSDLSLTKNIAIAETYELGSVMKPFAALAALGEGVVEYDELFDCGGRVAYVDGFRLENPKTLGVLPFYDVVRYSSNVALAKVALRLKHKLYDHLSGVGFGKKTGIEFPGERSGFINPPARWSRSSVMVMSFGYEITASLLQLACAGAVLVNGGHSVKPHVIKTLQLDDFSTKKPLYSPKVLGQINEIMTMIAKRYPVKGFLFKGKTGTARMVENGHYSTDKHIYTFMGFVERGDYKRVIVSFIQEPKKSHLWAADVAAPLAMRVAEKLALNVVKRD